MGEIIFITGTDTGVGKTVLTAFLLHHLRQKKIRALAMKPFCTGSREDVEILQKLQPGELSDSEMNPYFFPEPVAPFAAAKMHRQSICLDDVLEKISKIKMRCDVLLIEGAGGVMVPLGPNFMMRDLITRLRCRVVIVARNSLGTINHTLLSVSILQQTVLKELAIVFVDQKKPDFSSGSNLKTLDKVLFSTRLFSMPFFQDISFRNEAFNKNYKKVKKTLDVIMKCV